MKNNELSIIQNIHGGIMLSLKSFFMIILASFVLSYASSNIKPAQPILTNNEIAISEVQDTLHTLLPLITDKLEQDNKVSFILTDPYFYNEKNGRISYTFKLLIGVLILHYESLNFDVMVESSVIGSVNLVIVRKSVQV